MVGLANVDNTSDANKPVSTAVQTALNAKANTTDLSGYMVKPWVSMRYVGGTVYNYGQASIQSVNTNTNSGDYRYHLLTSSSKWIKLWSNSND
jgi:hypothetical protein